MNSWPPARPNTILAGNPTRGRSRRASPPPAVVSNRDVSREPQSVQGKPPGPRGRRGWTFLDARSDSRRLPGSLSGAVRPPSGTELQEPLRGLSPEKCGSPDVAGARPVAYGEIMIRVFVAALTTCLFSAMALAVEPSALCEAAKLRASSSFARCRLRADQVFATSGQTQANSDTRDAAYARCDDALVKAYGIAESKYGARCPTVGDAPDVRDALEQCSNDVGSALQMGGGSVPLAVLAVCGGLLKDALAGTATAEDVRAGKTFTSGEGVGRAGTASLTVANGLLQTGQTTSYGPGSDGDLRKGTPRSFTDNGDGTVTDDRTGLMWEKKSADGGIHDRRNFYTWTSSGCYGFEHDPMDGTMVTEFLAALNTPPCFGASPANPAGHCDWRIPNLEELESIRNLDGGYPWTFPWEFDAVVPATFPAFDRDCTSGCTVTTCSCTGSGDHWSSSGGNSGRPWTVLFPFGDAKSMHPACYALLVRAVRGGS